MDTRVTPYDLKWQASPISHPLLQIIFSLNKTSTIDWLISFKPSPRACPKHSQGSYQTRMLTGNVSEHMSPISNPDSSRLDRAGKTLGSRLISHILFWKNCWPVSCGHLFSLSPPAVAAYYTVVYVILARPCSYSTKNNTRKSNNWFTLAL